MFFKRKAREDEIFKNALKSETEKLLEESQKKIEQLSSQVTALGRDLDSSARELSKVKRERSDSNKDSLKKVLHENRRLWLETNPLLVSEETIYIEDPIHRQVSLEPEIAPIYYHPIVQRLGHIKQLSFSHLTFPSATHTRLSHSLGVCRNAELALGTMLRKGILYTPNGKKEIELTEKEKKKLTLKAKAAALLHDLGHGPFGHGLDQYMSSMMGYQQMKEKRIKGTAYDKDFSVRYIRDYLNAKDIDLAGICKIFSTDETKLEAYDILIKNVIDSPQDVDRMDYLVRDAHMTGLSIGSVNVQALIERMIPFEKVVDGKRNISLVFHRSAIPYITHLLYARDNMYMNCYEHPNKVVAEKMLVTAIDEFRSKNEVDIEDIVFLSDEQLLRLLIEFSEPDSIPYQYAVALLHNAPFEEVFWIQPRKWEEWNNKKEEKKKKHENQIPPLKPSKAIDTWEELGLFYGPRFISMPREWEKRIAAEAGLEEKDSWKVLITVPSTNMFEAKFTHIRILEQENGKYLYRKLGEITDYWEGILKYLGDERYTIRVFVSPDLSAAVRQEIYQAARKLFVEE